MSKTCSGAGAFCLFYLCCGVAAALAQAFSSPGSHVPMVGASGAIAGVLGAYLLLYPGANVHCFVWIVIFFRIVNVPAWMMLGLWFAMQLFSGLARRRQARAWRSGRMSAALLAEWSSSCSAAERRRAAAAAAQPRLHGRTAAAFAGRRTFHRGSVPSVGSAGSTEAGALGLNQPRSLMSSNRLSAAGRANFSSRKSHLPTRFRFFRKSYSPYRERLYMAMLERVGPRGTNSTVTISGKRNIGECWMYTYAGALDRRPRARRGFRRISFPSNSRAADPMANRIPGS